MTTSVACRFPLEQPSFRKSTCLSSFSKRVSYSCYDLTRQKRNNLCLWKLHQATAGAAISVTRLVVRHVNLEIGKNLSALFAVITQCLCQKVMALCNKEETAQEIAFWHAIIWRRRQWREEAMRKCHRACSWTAIS